MKRLNKKNFFIIFLTLLFSLSFIIPDDVFARRGGFGGGRSFRSSRSSSFGSKSRSKSWAKKSGKMSNKRGAAGNKKSMSSSKADKAAYSKAKANGTVYKSRNEATQAFNKKYGKQYTSTYKTQPAQRPGHIPQTTTANGRQHRVDYNPTYGGYGYFGPSGGWIMYSVIRDAAMMSMLMGNHGYYYGPRPGGGISTGLIVIIVIVLLAVFLRPRR